MGAKGTVSATFSLLLSLVLFNILCVHQIRADGTVGIVCYGYNGASYVNNTKCPGSNACCGYEATCVSNRLCHNPGDAEGTYVRGPCANDVWDSTCAQVCLYSKWTNCCLSANVSNTNRQFSTDETLLSGFLPRVSQCSDGSWCCSYDATCCSNGRGVFLDSDGNSATAEATATTSYPPVSGTGLVRYVSPSRCPQVSILFCFDPSLRLFHSPSIFHASRRLDCDSSVVVISMLVAELQLTPMATDRVSIHIDHFDNFCLNHKLELDHVLLSRFTGDCLCYIGH